MYSPTVLHTNTRKAGLTDELSYSVHYGEVSHLIKKVVEENTWKLLETVAEVDRKSDSDSPTRWSLR